jgi:hypothetical protein
LRKVGRQGVDAEIRAAQAVLQIQAGGALVAVDEDVVVHGLHARQAVPIAPAKYLEVRIQKIN